MGLFYKKKDKKNKKLVKSGKTEQKKKGLSEKTVTILIFAFVLLVSVIYAFIKTAGQGEFTFDKLVAYMEKFNQEVNITITDPVSVVNEEHLKARLYAAGLKTIATKEDLTADDIVSNTEYLKTDLVFTQAEVGALFNIILVDDDYDMNVSQLKISKDEDNNYSFETYINIKLTELLNEVPEAYRYAIPSVLILEYNFYFSYVDEAYVANDSDFKILNFADDINETVVSLFEIAMNDGRSVEQAINAALVDFLNKPTEGIIAWMGAENIVIDDGQVTFLKKVTFPEPDSGNSSTENGGGESGGGDQAA